MENNEMVIPVCPLVKLVVRKFYNGKVEIFVKYDVFMKSSVSRTTKLIFAISLVDVKNSPFVEVGGKGGITLVRPEFCESVTDICKELGIVIESLVLKTINDNISFPPHEMVFIQSLESIDRDYPEWSNTFAKQGEMVATLLNGTIGG